MKLVAITAVLHQRAAPDPGGAAGLPWPRYLLAVLLSSLAFLAMVGTLNRIVDPANLFGDQRDVVQRVAGALHAGRTVEMILQFDDRRLQRDLVALLDRAPELLITGSSRSRNIGAEFFAPGTAMRNASVNGATIDDLLVVHGLYDRAGKVPRQIIINVDPWLFNDAYGNTLWRSVADAHDHMSARLADPTAPARAAAAPSGPESPPLFSRASLSKWADLFTGAQLAGSFAEITRHKSRRRDPVRVLPETDGGFLLRPDGSFRWPLAVERETEATQFARLQRDEAEARPGELLIQLAGFTSVSAERKRLFEALIGYLRAQGSDVTLLLLPYHPRTYDRYLPQHGLLQPVTEVEAYVRSLRAKGFQVIGSFDPHRYGCTALEFVDQHHPLPLCSARIIGEWRALHDGTSSGTSTGTERR